MTVHVPDASVNVQKAFQEIEARLRALDRLIRQGAQLPSEQIEDLRREIAKATRKPSYQLWEDVFGTTPQLPVVSKDILSLKDDFATGYGFGDSDLGEMAWHKPATAAFGAVSSLNSEANHPGILRLSSTAVSGIIGRIHASGPISASAATMTGLNLRVWEYLVVARLNHVTQDVIRLGLQPAAGDDPGVRGVYFQVTNVGSAANWQAVTRSASTETATSTGVVADTNWHSFKIVSRGNSTIEFYIDGVKKATNTTNVPDGAVLLFMHIKNTEAVEKTIDFDYAHFWMTVSR